MLVLDFRDLARKQGLRLVFKVLPAKPFERKKKFPFVGIGSAIVSKQVIHLESKIFVESARDVYGRCCTHKFSCIYIEECFSLPLFLSSPIFEK